MSEQEFIALFSGLKLFEIGFGPAKTNRPVIPLIFAKEISARVHRSSLSI
jgi:hypothetical protein